MLWVLVNRMRAHTHLLLLAALLAAATEAGAVASAELYQNQTYTYGRFEARVRFAAGDGVISSFFLWKPGSEVAGTFWNELDFEKLGADCRLQTNPLYGLPVADHSRIEPIEAELCSEYHTYTFEWTPSYIAYFVDGVELRRDGEDVAAAFTQNAASGMQFHFNIWPGDATFGGNFDPGILPVQQYISWAQYSSFAAGEFTLAWREEFDGPTVPAGWAVGTWPSPKSLSTHQPANVVFSSGLAVLSLTADGATGFAGAPPPDEAAAGVPGGGGAAGLGGSPGTVPVAAASGGSTGAAPRAVSGAGGAGPSAGGANATASSATESGAAPSSVAPRAASEGGCQLSSPTANFWSTSWLFLAAVASFIARRQRRWLERGRAAAMQSRC
jgi:endo-1,3-1,4-beta-glycanase ExoK